jgi:hypothetical protein
MRSHGKRAEILPAGHMVEYQETYHIRAKAVIPT